MTNEQLYLALGVPVVVNTVMLGFFWLAFNKRLDDLEKRFSEQISSIERRLEARFSAIDQRFNALEISID